LEKWFWTYFGYSYEKKQAFAYVKFATEEKTLIFSNVWHEIPRYMGVYLGKDPFYPAFNGELKGWYFNAGKGSWKTLGEFEALYNVPIPK
jgi:protein transport protein SEC24